MKWITVLVCILALALVIGCKVQPINLDANKTLPTLTFTEGDFIELFTIVDKHSDLTYKFSPPFDRSGRWQTKIGDAGTYQAIIESSDGILATQKKFTVVVQPLPIKPKLSGVKDITVYEGETVTLKPIFEDPTNKTKITISGWMLNLSKKTKIGDRGTYDVTVNVSNDRAYVTKTIQVTILPINQPPVFDNVIVYQFKSNEKMQLVPQASDPDGDTIKYTYSKPLNVNGEWNPKDKDIGSYKVTITASDGQVQTSKNVTIDILPSGSAPIISQENVVVNQTQTVMLKPNITASRNYTISYSGWMNTSTRYVTENDEGIKYVNITATDGIFNTTKEVTITIIAKNKAPVFVWRN